MSHAINKKILLINGPNLNLLGSREPETYGNTTLRDIEELLIKKALSLNIVLTTVQSNSEGALVDAIHSAKIDNIQCVIINPGAYTHTSIALRDAFLSTELAFIEVHISNVYARESFRHTSYLSDISKGVIIGHGLFGYELALIRANNIIETEYNNYQ